MLSSAKPLKILIVDDHAFLLAGVRHFLSQFPDTEVVGEAGTGGEAVERIATAAPDLVLLDWRLPDTSGRTLIQRIKAGRNGIKVLVFSAHEREEIVQGALDAGADGFLSKGEDADTLLRAIRSVAAGQIWAGREQIGRFVRDARERLVDGTRDGKPLLTTREWEVARLVAEGGDNKAIAEKMFISEGTVRVHMSRILGKVGRKSRLQLALWVQEDSWSL